jgi:hypothetical protein
MIQGQQTRFALGKEEENKERKNGGPSECVFSSPVTPDQSHETEPLLWSKLVSPDRAFLGMSGCMS